MKKNILQYIIVSMIIFAVTGCQDDFVRMNDLGEGEAEISATVDFKPMSAALGSTRSSGTALKDIRSLHVLVYSQNKNELIKSWPITGYAVSDEGRTDSNAENGSSAEAETKQATFKLPERIEFGRYYMYAVANIPDLLTNPAYSDAIQTVEGLKNLPLTWDSGNVANNGQMIGCLITRKTTVPVADEPVEVKAANTELHAWLRRAASKVTVAFNGEGLKDDVSIYLKAVRIKNIPLTCKLGADNTIGKTGDLIADGEEVVYSDSQNFDESHPALVSNGNPFYPRLEDGSIDPDRHSETNPNSLYFFENLQGEGPDKRQDTDNDGNLDELFQYKQKPYATYIEVDTHFESRNPERPGICNITYRFMLGQNITTDYNAKRNCHYKLTLFFNGFADDPDWRIDYVTRLWVSDPKPVDYRGQFFVPNTDPNQGHNFSAETTFDVTSIMFEKDSWEGRIPVDFKVEYKDAGQTEFSANPPAWFDLTIPEKSETDKDGKETGVYKVNINYKNPYEEVSINKILGDTKASDRTNYDLSTKGGTTSMNTANSYIVDAKGTYTFPLVYGNAIVNGATNSSSYSYSGWAADETISKSKKLATFLNYKATYNETDSKWDDAGIISDPYILKDIYRGNTPVPTGISASIIRQDEQNLVTGVEYVAGGKEGKIKFTVGDNIKQGNAVIALKDPSGKIMWSWHIWVTAFDLSKTATLTNRSDQQFEILPVNLGWCSGYSDAAKTKDIPVRYYDYHECEVKITQLISENGQEGQPSQDGKKDKGVYQIVKIIQHPHIAIPCGNNPYYQWGRKDPFIAGGNSNDDLTEKKDDGSEVAIDNPNANKKWYDAGGKEKASRPALMYTKSDDSDRVLTWKATPSLIQNPDKWQNGPRQSPGDNGNKFKPNDVIYYNLWDNRTWDDNHIVIKTIYDPCPVGYNVSPRNTFTGFTSNGEKLDKTDFSKKNYSAEEGNMMPQYDKNGNEDKAYNNYRERIVEFYTDKTKLVSIGFPTNGYRDWDAEARLLKYNERDGYAWIAQSDYWSSFPYLAFNLQFNRTSEPHIWPVDSYYATDGFPVRPTKTVPLQ